MKITITQRDYLRLTNEGIYVYHSESPTPFICSPKGKFERYMTNVERKESAIGVRIRLYAGQPLICEVPNLPDLPGELNNQFRSTNATMFFEHGVGQMRMSESSNYISICFEEIEVEGTVYLNWANYFDDNSLYEALLEKRYFLVG